MAVIMVFKFPPLSMTLNARVFFFPLPFLPFESSKYFSGVLFPPVARLGFFSKPTFAY